MPVGNIKYFVGDITKVDPKAYGFIYCRITSPKYLHKPIIQTQVETPEGQVHHKQKDSRQNKQQHKQIEQDRQQSAKREHKQSKHAETRPTEPKGKAKRGSS